jgi:hypothetical protein
MEELEMIIRYLDGEVIGEEKQSFEKELAINGPLNQKLCLVKEVDEVIADEELFNYIEKLNKAQVLCSALESEDSMLAKLEKTGSSKKRFISNWQFLAAASITLMLVLSTFSYFYFSGSPSDKLFSQYYQHYDAGLVTRSVSANDVNELVTAIQLYDKSMYKDAIVQFEKIIKADATNTAARFFIGVSYIEVKNYNKAIENLAFVVTKNDTAFAEHAQWYLALCYVKTNQNSKAKQILNVIASGKNYYKSMAQQVLQKIK